MEKWKKIREELLQEMHRVVNVPFILENITKPEWYMLHEWTAEQQASFKDWGVDYLRKKARITKNLAEREMGMFILSYGWKTK